MEPTASVAIQRIDVEMRRRCQVSWIKTVHYLTGRSHANDRHKRRLKDNPKYNDANEILRKLRKRRDLIDILKKYTDAVVSHFETLMEERMHPRHSILRWRTIRSRMRTFSLWSDRLFERSSCKRTVLYKEDGKEGEETDHV